MVALTRPQQDTTGDTPSLAIVARQPYPCCAWCGVEMPDARPGQRFCKPGHKQKEYEARQRGMPPALYMTFVDMTIRGLMTWDELPPVARIAEALEWAKPGRRNALMSRLGYVWDNGSRAWVKS